MAFDTLKVDAKKIKSDLKGVVLILLFGFLFSIVAYYLKGWLAAAVSGMVFLSIAMIVLALISLGLFEKPKFAGFIPVLLASSLATPVLYLFWRGLGIFLAIGAVIVWALALLIVARGLRHR
jgi:hypothetical protein